MRTKTFFQIIGVVLISSGLNCKKMDSNTNGNHPIVSIQVDYVTASVSGRVIDQSRKPISNAAISTIFGASALTDVNGQFTLANIQLDKNAAYVTASKSGYFVGSRTFQISAGSSNLIEIELIAESQSGQFNSLIGGTVTIGNGGSINFSGNSITDVTSGSPYSGTVNVNGYYIDPSGSNFGGIMPGQLSGIGPDSSLRALQAMSMMALDLRGSNGQKLQITNGKTASVTFPIPSSLISSAPATIPLWYFDEVKGLWRQQGTAALSGTNYVGSVSHFTYWAAEGGIPSILMQVVIDNKANTPLSGAHILIKGVGNNNAFLYDDGYTDVQGEVVGRPIPSNETLKMIVFDHCGDSVYSQTFTTANTNINLGTLVANVNSNPVTFSGTMTDCFGNPIANGILNLFIDGLYTSANIANGKFSVTINRCSQVASTASITGIDLSTNLQDTLSLQNVTSTNFDSLKLSVCNLPDEYVYYTVKGNSDTLTLANYSFNTYGFQQSIGHAITAYTEQFSAESQNNNFALSFFDTTAINKVQSNVTLYLSGYDTVSNKLDSVTLFEFGRVGSGYIMAGFSGQLLAFPGAIMVPIQGRFRTKRTN